METTQLMFKDASNEIVDFFGSEKVEVNDSRGYIVIHFPFATVTNEFAQSTDITHLFVKVGINSNGCYSGNLGMLRTEYTEAQLYSRYSHSHLPTLIWPIEYKQPCLGTGPLRSTLTTLAADPTAELWKLFCLELSKFVETESIEGVPYRYIRDIGNERTFAYSSSYSSIDSDIYKKDIIPNFVNYIIRNKAINLRYFHSYSAALDQNELAITVSNLFFQWCNELSEVQYARYQHAIRSLLRSGRYSGNQVKLISGDTVDNELFTHEGAPILTFKGEIFPLTIIKQDNYVTDNILTLLSFNVVAEIINILMFKIDFEYGIEQGNLKGARILYL